VINLLNEINRANSTKEQLNIQKSEAFIKIEECKNNIIQAKYSSFEMVLTILTLGLINFGEKYKNIIAKNKKRIIELEKSLDRVEMDLAKTLFEIDTLNEELEKKLDVFKYHLIEFQKRLILLAQKQYINTYTRVEIEEKANALLLNKEQLLQHQKIQGLVDTLQYFYANPQKWISEQNELFIKKEKESEKIFFDTIESNPLKPKQQDAVLVNENNNLILAGAGSGKTSVIVAKVAYLLKKEILHPNEILILAFNKNAQQELEERLKSKKIYVSVKTFHSFGLSIIAQTLSKKPDLCKMSESPIYMTKFIQTTIQELISLGGVFIKTFLELIAYFKIPEKSQNEFKNKGEYYEYLESYDLKTLKHEVEFRSQGNESLITLKEDKVKSFEELKIANFLTLNGIRYLYEDPYKYPTYTIENRQYKPDFYLPDYDIYIEHYGINRDNTTAPTVNNKEYLEGIEWKRQLHKDKQTTCIETYSYENQENILLERLKEKLLEHNVIFRELSEAQMREILKDALDDNNSFTKLFTTFLNHYKANMHTMRELKDKSKETKRTNLFVQLFEFIFDEYKKFQKQNFCIDFDDMIVEALLSIEEGKYKHTFKHIFIDEFQDISTTRAKLIAKLLPINQTSITAVGDDWQSINRFAGSNIKIIQEFEQTFGVSQTVALDYTFRFDNIVSNVASDFIQKNPYQIKKEIKTLKTQHPNKFTILLYWTTQENQKNLNEILKMIASKEKENAISVMVLARYNFLLNDLSSLQKQYPNFNIIFSTVHSSKGNEADYVIILNLDNGKFGFPSTIEDDPILKIVVPKGDDYTDAEERRLFYVALTRTKKTLFLLSDMYNQSTFIRELISNYKDEIFFINDPKIKPLSCPDCKTGFLKKRTDTFKKDKHFYGCSNFPRCEYTENVYYCPYCDTEVQKYVDEKIARYLNDDCNFETFLCKECNGYMIERKGKYGDFLGCSNYPKCSNTQKV